MPDFNYIIADNYLKQKLIIELLTIHHINKTKNKYYQCLSNTYTTVHFIEVIDVYCSFDKLVSIMKPHGIKVITGNKFRDNGLDEYIDNYTKEKHSSLYDPEDNDTFIPPTDTKKHLEGLMEGIHYMYRYNLDELICNYHEFLNTGIHKLRHQAILNRLTLFFQKKMIKDYCNSH